MRKKWDFDVKGYSVRVTNSWLHGMKLYVNGDLRDHDPSFFAFGHVVTLSASLGEEGIIEIEPKAYITVKIDVYLVKNNKRSSVFSSTRPFC